MKRSIDKAIVLRRTNYGERDRVVSLLCEQRGKITVFAKGARSQKSRVSAGIELLTVSEVGFIDGKSDMKTLISANIITRYENVVQDVGRTGQFFEALKKISKIIEDGTGQEYFTVLDMYMKSLDNMDLDARIVEIWFELRVMQIAGVLGSMEVVSDSGSSDLHSYTFNYDEQIFVKKDDGGFTENDIKMLWVLKSSSKPVKLTKPLESIDMLLQFIRTLYAMNTP